MFTTTSHIVIVTHARSTSACAENCTHMCPVIAGLTFKIIFVMMMGPSKSIKPQNKNASRRIKKYILGSQKYFKRADTMPRFMRTLDWSGVGADMMGDPKTKFLHLFFSAVRRPTIRLTIKNFS